MGFVWSLIGVNCTFDGELDVASRFAFFVGRDEGVEALITHTSLLDVECVDAGSLLRCDGDSFARLDLDAFLQPNEKGE